MIEGLLMFLVEFLDFFEVFVDLLRWGCWNRLRIHGRFLGFLHHGRDWLPFLEYVHFLVARVE